MDANDQTIIDGTVVEEKGKAEDLVTVTNLIQSYIGQIDRAQKEISAQKQMLQDAFGNDPTYREHDEKVKEAVKVRTATKQQILKQPTLRELSEKIKEMTTSLKEARQSLSDYLQEFARISGARQIEDAEGEIREIVYVAKLVKSSSSKEFKKKG